VTHTKFWLRHCLGIGIDAPKIEITDFGMIHHGNDSTNQLISLRLIIITNMEWVYIATWHSGLPFLFSIAAQVGLPLLFFLQLAHTFSSSFHNQP